MVKGNIRRNQRTTALLALAYTPTMSAQPPPAKKAKTVSDDRGIYKVLDFVSWYGWLERVARTIQTLRDEHQGGDKFAGKVQVNGVVVAFRFMPDLEVYVMYDNYVPIVHPKSSDCHMLLMSTGITEPIQFVGDQSVSDAAHIFRLDQLRLRSGWSVPDDFSIKLPSAFINDLPDGYGEVITKKLTKSVESYAKRMPAFPDRAAWDKQLFFQETISTTTFTATYSATFVFDPYCTTAEAGYREPSQGSGVWLKQIIQDKASNKESKCFVSVPLAPTFSDFGFQEGDTCKASVVMQPFVGLFEWPAVKEVMVGDKRIELHIKDYGRPFPALEPHDPSREFWIDDDGPVNCTSELWADVWFNNLNVVEVTE